MIDRNPAEAFEDAIANGRLSDDENATNFAGNFMYMGTMERDGRKQDTFKNINTREYLQ